jgi:hypothetical protein
VGFSLTVEREIDSETDGEVAGEAEGELDADDLSVFELPPFPDRCPWLSSGSSQSVSGQPSGCWTVS